MKYLQVTNYENLQLKENQVERFSLLTVFPACR